MKDTKIHLGKWEILFIVCFAILSGILLLICIALPFLFLIVVPLEIGVIAYIPAKQKEAAKLLGLSSSDLMKHSEAILTTELFRKMQEQSVINEREKEAIGFMQQQNDVRSSEIDSKERMTEEMENQIRKLVDVMRKSRDNMNGEQYEIYCAVRLASIGWGKIELTKASGDFGVDVLAYKDGAKYCVQCKCYSSPVGIQAVQEAYSGKGYYDCDKALVVTNNKFTSAAHELANKLGVTLMEDF